MTELLVAGKIHSSGVQKYLGCKQSFLVFLLFFSSYDDPSILKKKKKNVYRALGMNKSPY